MTLRPQLAIIFKLAKPSTLSDTQHCEFTSAAKPARALNSGPIRGPCMDKTLQQLLLSCMSGGVY